MFSTSETGHESTSIMSVLFIIIFVWAIFGNGFGRGGEVGHSCGCVSNCEVQKQEIIDNARNLYAIEQSTYRTVEASRMDADRVQAQLSRQWDADQAEKLFDSKINAQTTAILNGQALASKDAEIYALKGQIYTDAKFGAIEAQLYDLSCSTPKRPPYYAQGFVTTGQPVPTNGFCNC